jgi:putative ABC transport system permease protein
LSISTRQRASFLWTEARWIITAGILGGIATGTLIAAELVKVLNWIFDPPPQHPAVPTLFLTALLVVVTATAALTTAISTRWAARVDASRLRDL